MNFSECLYDSFRLPQFLLAKQIPLEPQNRPLDWKFLAMPTYYSNSNTFYRDSVPSEMFERSYEIQLIELSLSVGAKPCKLNQCRRILWHSLGRADFLRASITMVPADYSSTPFLKANQIEWIFYYFILPRIW